MLFFIPFFALFLGLHASFACGKFEFEKVNPAHPDKIADRIAGAIVDLAYS